jgi:xanthine dehydrogenase YagS FAD-binding subunit
MAVAMAGFEAVIHTDRRSIPISDFYVPYGEDPARENILEPRELIIAVELPHMHWFARSTYVKARDRSSFEFALASAAVAVGGGDCRIALGGVATMPWRSHAAEEAFRQGLSNEHVAETALEGAVPQRQNAFKIELCKRVLVKALQEVTQ